MGAETTWFILLAACLFSAASVNGAVTGTNHGPAFTNEPPRLVEFSNNTGAKIECTATGDPTPKVTWSLSDGTSVTNIASLRQVHADGTLVFPPFSASDFRQDIHAAVYRCVASNAVGVVVSGVVQVKAVLLQPYIVHIYDVYAILGNTAVMKCHVPTFLLDYVHVTSWIRDAAFVIQTTADKEGKYVILPSGELHIREVNPKDAMTNFRCQTHHRLTGETRLSASAGRLFVTEPQGNVSPRILTTQTAVHVRQGETAILSCVAQGYPVPNTTWFVKGSKGDLQLLRLGDRVSQKVDALVIRGARVSDSGIYVCVANNLVGAEQAETLLTVTAPLHAKIEPAILVAEIKKPAAFACVISGSPVSSVTWMKDGKPIVSPKPVRAAYNEKFRIESVSTEDRGMYQCIVENDYQIRQAAAELRLGDIAPEFVSVFEEKLQQPGTSVSLRCVARGVPLPQITWFLDDLPLPRNDRFHTDTYINRKGDRVSILNVTHMRVEDGGVYKCESQSSAGVVQHSARINIYGRPAVRPMPKMSVVAGHDVRINCAMYGYPIESIDWEKDGAPIPLDLRRMMLANGTLLIGSIERSTDSGRYRCIVRNKQGNTGSGEVEVVVMVSPKIIPFSFQDEYLREGTQARVMCALIEGDPPVKFQWLKDSRPIPSAGMAGIMVRNFDDFTSILTISHVASHHRGNYTCVAENAAASAAHTTPLKVNVPPTILPFSFQDEHLLEGTLASVSCVVSRGDLPLSLSWEKDGLPLVPSAAKGVKIMAHGDSLSILSIGPAFPVHNGNYTCVASNVASTMRYTAHLSVKVPPRWTLEPKNTMVLFGRSTVIHCQAEGFPPPSVTWMKARGTEVTDQTDVLESGDEFHVFQNGSLLVKHATESHRGYYFCAATNGIGTGLSRGVFLQVHIPAEIETKMQSFTVVEGEIIRARCEAKGDHPIDFTWSTDGQTIESGQHSRYYFKDHVTPTRAVSELTVTNAQKMDTRIFVCMARNPYGGDMANIQIIVQGIPDAPKIVKIIDIGNRSVELAWNPPYDGNSRITKYIVQYKPIQGDWTDEVSNLSVSGGQSSIIIRALTPSVGYHFRMFSENSVGLSAPSDVVYLTMEDEAPGAPPQDVEVEAMDPQTLRVMWKPPPKEMWNGAIRGYYVGFRIYGTEDPFNVQTVEVPDEYMEEMKLRIPDLQKFTQYGVMVQAFNDKGLGPKSEEIVVMTSEDVPSRPPQNVRCSVTSSSVLHVTWQPPPADALNGILRGYRVVYKNMEEWSGSKIGVTHTTATYKTLDSLEKNANYSVQVMGYTNMGDGVKSEAVFCKTKEDVPAPPAEIKVLPLSTETVLVVWKPPTRPNGFIIKYNVYARELEDENKLRSETHSSRDAMQRTSQHNFPTKHSVRGDAVQYEVKGLKANQRYEFWVTATTAVGEGKSTAIIAEALTGAISAPKSASFNEGVITAWKKEVKLTCRGVGQPSPDREWSFRGVRIQSTGRVVYANDGSLVIKNIQTADAGNYSCRIFNRNGEDFVHYTVVVLVPPSAPVVRVLSTTLTSIELRWSAETSERSPLQGFMLHYQPDNGHWETKEIDSDYERYRLENLLCGTKYNIFVEAYNKIGLSEPCETITTFTEGMAPERPSKDRLIDEGIGSLALHLDSWNIRGCPILYFTVEYKLRDNDEWVAVEGGAKNTDQKKFLLDELQAETWYNIRMKAYTSAGFTEGTYTVGTLTLSGATMNPDILHSDKGVLFYLDLRIIIPVVVVLIILFLSITTICFVINRKRAEDKRAKGKTPLDVKNAASALGLPSGKEFNMTHAQNSDQLSRRYTSTPTRVALGSQEDLAPYSAYQLPNYHYGELKTFSSGQRKVDGPGNGDLYWQEKKSPASEHSYKDKIKDVNPNLNITPTTNSTTGSLTQPSQIPTDSYNTWSSSLKRSQPGLDGRVDPSSEASSKVKAPSTRTGGATEETTFIFPVPPSVNGTAVTIHGTLQGDLYDRLTPSRAGTLQVEKKFPNADESTRLLK